MAILKDITGKRFGRLIVIRFSHRNKDRKYLWLCKCDCGNETISESYSLRTGGTKSCGCYKKELSKLSMKKVSDKYSTTHGMTGTPEYITWHSMKGRCLDKKNKRYKDYGGRGILICERWLNSFENFFTDMGKRPSKEYSLDRKDVNGNYEPNNCKWSTRKEQQNNMRNNKILIFNGSSKTLSIWAEELNINKSTLAKRISRGWTIERALTT